ncbi:MAG: acyl-CoA thioesterase [Phaeodactylibacter sp.]|nr:acyl-CoA thioesterase [Phaeodactylibacter sp.]
MLSHEYQKRVRYGETDKMGYLYYGNYLQYYEIGRVELLRSLGLTYQAMEDEIQVMMPVVHAEVRYLRPAYYDNLITIRTTIRELPEKYIVFHMELINEAGKLINTGRVRLCFVDMQTNKTLDQPPLTLLEKMKPYFE